MLNVHSTVLLVSFWSILNIFLISFTPEKTTCQFLHFWTCWDFAFYPSHAKLSKDRHFYWVSGCLMCFFCYSMLIFWFPYMLTLLNYHRMSIWWVLLSPMNTACSSLILEFVSLFLSPDRIKSTSSTVWTPQRTFRSQSISPRTSICTYYWCLHSTCKYVTFICFPFFCEKLEWKVKAM